MPTAEQTQNDNSNRLTGAQRQEGSNLLRTYGHFMSESGEGGKK